MYLIVSLTQMAVYGAYLREALGFCRPAWQLILWWAAFELADLAAVRVLNLPWTNALVYLLGLEAVAFGMCYGKRVKKAFLVLAYDAMLIILEAICANAIILFGICDTETMMENAMISYSVLLLEQIFVFALTQIAIYIWKRYAGNEIEGKNWAGLFGMCGGCFAATAIVATNMLSLRMFSAGQVTVLVIMVAQNFLCYYFYTVSAEKNKAITEARMYEKQINMYREWYEDICSNRQKMQAFRHDAKNHINALRCLSQKGGGDAGKKLEEISRYIGKISMDYLEISGDVESGNPMLDAVIGTKKNYAAARGIKTEAKLSVPEGMEPDGVDMVILLGNLLDNAIEASERAKTEISPEIGVDIRYQTGNLILIIRNTYDGHLDGRDSEGGILLRTDKKDGKQHGIGMKNILGVVAKYSGTMTWRAEKGIFTTTVILYEFDRK